MKTTVLTYNGNEWFEHSSFWVHKPFYTPTASWVFSHPHWLSDRFFFGLFFFLKRLTCAQLFLLFSPSYWVIMKSVSKLSYWMMVMLAWWLLKNFLYFWGCLIFTECHVSNSAALTFLLWLQFACYFLDNLFFKVKLAFLTFHILLIIVYWNGCKLIYEYILII